MSRTAGWKAAPGKEIDMDNVKPYIIGLTGGIACGKSTVADCLRELQVFVIDADEISRALTAPGGEALPQIEKVFGPRVFHEDGSLDRRALGQIVFADEASRRALEGIIHPAVQRRTLQLIDQAASQGEPVVVLDVPLLFETGMDALCDECWVVTLDRETQKKRLMARDHLSSAEADERIDSQMPIAEKEKRANTIIRNGRNVEQTYDEVHSLVRELRRRLK